MRDPSAELVAKLLDLEGADLLAAIDDVRSEAFYVDFKRHVPDGNPRRLSDANRKQLAKAISGFANGAGGVLIWGVECSTTENGWDEIQSVDGVEDGNQLRALLDDHAHKVTLPPQVAVQSHVTRALPNGKHLVVTHVPKGSTGPVQSLITERFHVRSASSFTSVPYAVLAGMFGSSPAPELGLIVFPGEFARGSDPRHGTGFQVKVTIVVQNVGAVAAYDPYVTLRLPQDDLSTQHMAFDASGQHWNLNRGAFGVSSIVYSSGAQFPPGFESACGWLELFFPDGKYWNPVVEIGFGAGRHPPKHLALRVTDESWKRAITEWKVKENRITQADQLLISRLLFGLETDG
ncbi:MAG: ATP-binding protein [Planctomycetota bacterium]